MPRLDSMSSALSQPPQTPDTDSFAGRDRGAGHIGVPAQLQGRWLALLEPGEVPTHTTVLNPYMIPYRFLPPPLGPLQFFVGALRDMSDNVVNHVGIQCEVTARAI